MRSSLGSDSRHDTPIPRIIEQSGAIHLVTQSLQAIFEKGVLRPLEPLSLTEHQQVTVIVSDQKDEDWADASFLRYVESQADESVTLEQVRSALAKISGSMLEDFRKERDERT